MRFQKFYLYPLYYSLLANELLLTSVTNWISFTITVSTMKAEKTQEPVGGKRTCVTHKIDYGSNVPSG